MSYLHQTHAVCSALSHVRHDFIGLQYAFSVRTFLKEDTEGAFLGHAQLLMAPILFSHALVGLGLGVSVVICSCCCGHGWWLLLWTFLLENSMCLVVVQEIALSKPAWVVAIKL